MKCRECDEKAHARRLCVFHYNHWRRSDPEYRKVENAAALLRSRTYLAKNKDEIKEKVDSLSQIKFNYEDFKVLLEKISTNYIAQIKNDKETKNKEKTKEESKDSALMK